MGTHAKPRTRVRSIALGTLAVGATLTAVGLTAAALDPTGANLADGTQAGDPVDLAASGLGAPVPVADVSSLGGAALSSGGLSTGTLSLGTVPTLGTGGLLPGSVTAPRPGQAAAEPTWAHGATGANLPEHQTPQGTATSAASPTGAASPASSGGNTANNTGGAGSGSLGTVNGLLPTGRLPLDQLSASSVDTTLNQVAPGVPGNLSSGLGKAKSTVAGLLAEVAGLL